MTWNYIAYRVENRKGIITLNRPEKRNALNAEMVTELKECFRYTRESEEKVIILEAAGEVFSAGADLQYLQELQQNSLQENLEDSKHLKGLFHQIYTHPKVVIAHVEGHAIAGGCGLATVCDLSFTIPEAKFGYTEVKIGFVPALVMVFLIRKIGESKTRELLLTGNLIDGKKAVDMGMINFLSDKENIKEDVHNFAEKLITGNSGDSMQITKQMISRVQDLTLDNSLDYAATMNAEARATDDCVKGIDAFLRKNKISW